jgi:hypothetical protein
MRVRVLGASGTLAILLTGCASLTQSSSVPVQLTSDPPGATARTTLGPTCVTPCTVTVSRSDQFAVVFSMEGFEEQTVEVRPRQVGSGGMFGDLFGPEMEPSPNPVFAKLVPPPKPMRPVRRARPKR